MCGYAAAHVHSFFMLYCVERHVDLSVSVSFSMLVTLSVTQHVSQYLCMNKDKNHYSSNFSRLYSVFLKLGRVPCCKSFLRAACRSRAAF
jgi:hypothetical protein